jgi:L-amino acid N-acyltransferase YncA
MTFDIRNSQREDLPRIVEIYNATIPSRRVTADTEPVTVESRMGWFEAHAPGRRPLWVAVEGTRIVGWLSLSTFYGRPAYDGTVELSVYVDEQSQRRGVASRLLEHALAQSRGLGVGKVVGFVFRHNTPSLCLLHRYGFQRWGLMPAVAVLDGVACDVVILGREVTA